MTRIVLIGGTGAALLVPAASEPLLTTPGRWGETSGPLSTWICGSTEVFFLPRHGPKAGIAPHLVNYRANIDAISRLAPDAVIGINAVGGIAAPAVAGKLVLPDQIIDYTWGRAGSFSDGNDPVRHIEFDPPFTEPLRRALVGVARAEGVGVMDGGTYGVTQGPRLETAAEIDRLERDGCGIVGMTAMPEAVLAREAGLSYAICALVVNRAAGRLRPGTSIHAEIGARTAAGMALVGTILDRFIAGL